MRVDVSMEFMKICGSGVRRKRDLGQEKGGKPLKKLLETKRKRKRKLRPVMKGRDPEKSQKVRTIRNRELVLGKPRKPLLNPIPPGGGAA